MLNNEKLCLFFASDYHFEMISLPYISRELKEDKKVIVITENDLNDTVNELLSKVNLKVEDKEKLENIDWKSNNLHKFEEMKKANDEGREVIVFVKGKEDYISDVNKNMQKLINFNATKVVDCYDINKVESDISDIAKKYNHVLSTSGVEKLL